MGASLRRLLVIGSFGLVGGAHAAYFQGLGFLDGGDDSQPLGISADGRAVVGSANGQAFRWTREEGMVALAPAGSYAAGASADGSVVVGASQASGRPQEAFRWTPSSGLLGLGFLSSPGRISRAGDVSSDGSVIVGSGTSANAARGRVEAFRWTESGGFLGLGFLPNAYTNESYGLAVSADGNTIVGQAASIVDPPYGTAQAFRWTPTEGMTGLGFLPGGKLSSSAFDVSADGSVVVGFSDVASGSSAFRWTADEGMVAIDPMSGGRVATGAFGVSADGSVVVGAFDSVSNDFGAFIWDAEHGTRDLSELLKDLDVDLTGWQLAWARAVSADGNVIMGLGVDPQGRIQGWIASLSGKALPEPSTFAILVLGFISLAVTAATRRRQSRLSLE